MSADNYYFVSKTDDGKFAVSHRFASIYYRDEEVSPPREYTSVTGTHKGWSVNGDKGPWFASADEAIRSSPEHPEWIVDPPQPRSTHDTLAEALMTAHKYVSEDYIVEYGVCVQEGLV